MATRYAIIGVANRFPGSANTPQAFWNNLISRRDCIVRAPADRWNADVFTSKDKDRPGKTLSSNCGFIDNVYDFDYEAFGISKREAEQMDPQQKVLLEVSLQALEDAGIRYQNSKTGVFIGIGQEEQFAVTTYDKDTVSPYSVTGSALSIASNRISFVFNLQGPSLSVDTACSSAVTAMHLALNALDAGQCEQALVGGVNLLTDPSVMIQFSKLGVLAPDSKCKSFDASANGYVRAEGCGVVILKPFESAVRDGDHIYCVIRGSAINSDGKRSPSLTMPSADAQKEVFRRAASQAKVNPQDVFFVEAHATGTKVGDPTEANAIGEVFGGAARSQPLRLGAVKTNVGHLECASFMAGLIKSVLMLDNQTLLPNINYSSPNPDIKFDALKMQVQTEPEAFNADGKLIAISSFGFGGSNGCCILEGVDKTKLKSLVSIPRPLPNVEFPLLPPPYLFVASAETTKALDTRVESLKSKLALNAAEIPQLSATLLRRELHRYVSFGVGESPATATFTEAKQRGQREPIVWVFAGQGPQHENMGRQLYQKFPVFRESIEASDRTYSALAGFSLVKNVGLFGPKVEGADPNAVYQLRFTLPSLIFLQIALIDLWTSFGVKPDVVVGHSFGEMAAAYASGVCSREQIVETAFHRAKLLDKLDGRGTMMALGCGEAQVQQWLHADEDGVRDDPTRQVWVAAYNSVDAVTVGGTHEGVAAFAAKCKEANIWHRVLKINSAYHTPVMNPVREEALKLFSELLAETFAPNTPFYSTVEGRFFAEGEKLPTSYMWSNIEQPVRFRDAVTGIVERFGENAVFMEMSAHPVLSSYIKHPSTGAKNAIYTLHRENPEQNTILQCVSQLLTLGHSVDIRGLLGHSVEPLMNTEPALRYPLAPQFCYKESRDLVTHRTAPEGTWRPLLGRLVPHPDTEQLWSRKISIPHHLWVQDHVVQDTVVFPGAGYVEMALEAFETLSVSNVVIDKVMALADKDTRDVRISVTPHLEDEEDDAKDIKSCPKTVKIFSKADPWDSSPWVLHASAHFNPREKSHDDFANVEWTQPLIPMFQAYHASNTTPANCRSYNRRDCYERFKSIGLNYGTVFQGIHSLVQTGEREGFAVMDFSQIDNSEEKFKLHPGVLDACFQVLLGVIKSLATAYVPVNIKKITWRNAMPDTLPANKQVAVFARAVPDSADAASITGDIVVMDIACTEVLGRVREMKAAALSNANANDASQIQRNYATSWQSWKLPELDASLIPSTLELTNLPAPVDELCKVDNAVLDVACKTYIANALKGLPATFDVKAQPLHRQRYLQWCQQTIEGFTPSADAVSMESAKSVLGVEAEAIQRVGENMVQLLKDPLSAQKILFSDDLMDRLYKTSTSFAPYVDALVHMFGELLQKQVALNNRVIRIVEVGAGTGGLTERLIGEIVRVLGGRTAPAVRYMFTDISQKFLNDARKKFQEHSWIDYRLLNLETKPSEQAIPAHSIDIVLAFDVLHVASDIDSCLANVREMLTPGGLLLAIEPTKPPVWMDMYFGLFKEWLNFSDATRMGRGKCTMPLDVWNSVLSNNNFKALKTLASAPEFVHGLIIAQSGLTDSAIAEAATVAHKESKKQMTVFADGSLEELLTTVQGMMSSESSNADKTLIVVTHDAQPVGNSSAELNLNDAQRIGFARVVASEYPEADIRIVDMPSSFPKEMIQAWTDRVFAMAQSNVLLDRELAVRGEQVFVPRLRLLPDEAAPGSVVESPKAEEHFRLDIGTRGQLSTLFWAETRVSLDSLAPQDVVVDVNAAAMNFKDLMIALGMITVPTKNKRANINLGLEFSGKVVAVGSGVKHVSVGQEVFGVGSNCFASRVLTSSDLVVPKPAHLTHVEAASLPIVFATCYSALMAKARIERDEVVLVHSGAGGIGQAAIQLCKKTGAEVIATVSSEEKRQFLQSKYGVTKFSDSRDPEIWASEVAKMTESRGGVDVVLNSLKGRAIPMGLECLSLGGRFVEIGKVDILRNSKIGMGHLLRDISLHSVQLDIVMDEQQHVMRKYLAAVSQLAEAKDIQPIVDLVVPAAKIEQAFRYMMAGKHKGKIVIDFSAPAGASSSKSYLATEGIPLRRKLFDADCCYVISGGLGALGWETFKWMAREEGATRFILMSRSGKLNDTQKSELAELQKELQNSVKLHVAACDVASREQVENAFKSAKEQKVLLENVGIYHMAMVLRDARLPNMTAEMMREAIACKVDGANFLLEFSQKYAKNLDFVLMFSSISSTFGNPDQANYAAGNSYLDAMTAALAAKMPSTKVGVINLSGVEDVGVLAEDFRLRQMSRLRGLQAGLTVRRVLEQIRTMLTRNKESLQWVFGNFAFKPLVETFPMLRAKCDHLVDYRIAVVNDDAGKTVVSVETVTAAVARLFAVDPKTIEAQAPLTQLGLDSLLAVELSATLKKNFDVKFTQMELLGGVSVEKIVARATGAK